MTKLNKEGVEKYPHFFNEVEIIREDETRYRIKSTDGRQLWIDKSFVESIKKKQQKEVKAEKPNKEEK